MAIVAISTAPSGTSSSSLSKYVAKALKIAQNDKRVRYRLDPMFTTLEGDLSDCLDVAQKMHEALFEAGADRVGTVIKIDDRRDKKVNSLLKK